MSVKDMIRSSILESEVFSQSMTFETFATIIIDMMVALILGYIIYRIYKRFFTGVVYSRSFGVTLIGMTVLTCMVTLAISTNIVISLGMVGALSIVRYRTAVKEPLDIMYLFWAITTGITVGASMYALAAAGMLIMLILILAASRMKDGRGAYVMVVHHRGDEAGDAILAALKPYPYSVKSSILKESGTELTVQIDMDKDDGIAARIRDIRDVDDVTMIRYNGEYHG